MNESENRSGVQSDPVLSSAGSSSDGITAVAIPHETRVDDESSPEIQEAEKRQAWRESPENAKLSRIRRFIWGLTPIAAAGGALVGWSYAGYSHNRGQYAAIGAGIGILTWLYIGIYYLFLAQRQLKRAFDDRRLLHRSRDALKEAEEKLKESSSTEFGVLWDATQKRLDYYHKIATTQSEKKLSIRADRFRGRVCCNSCSCYNCRTVKDSNCLYSCRSNRGCGWRPRGLYRGNLYENSGCCIDSAQGSTFLQPLEFSKYLAAERLVKQIPEDDRAKAVQTIIDSITNATHPAE